MSKEFKILIQSENDGVRVQIKGTKSNLMYALAHLSESLLNNSNLTKEEIKFAIDAGLKSEEEREEETKKQSKEINEKLGELMNILFN